MARRRGGRVRLRDVIANANQKINQAGGTLSGIDKLVVIAEAFVENADDFVDELKDGIGVKFVRSGEGSIMDFVTGQIDELPISIRIDVEEED